jgi:uncharacterized membrane protein
MKQNQDKLRATARKSLAGKWSTSAVVSFLTLTAVVMGMGSMFFSGPIALFCTLAGIFITPIMLYGLFVVFLRNIRGEQMSIKGLFVGFLRYGNVLSTMLLMHLYIILWSLAGIIPGIIKAYSYALTPYILHDHPEMGGNEAIRKSAEMMKGYKRQLFLMDLSFAGWGLLCILSLGIGFLWLIPYMQSARSAFYEEVRSPVYVYRHDVYAIPEPLVAFA